MKLNETVEGVSNLSNNEDIERNPSNTLATKKLFTEKDALLEKHGASKFETLTSSLGLVGSVFGQKVLGLIFVHLHFQKGFIAHFIAPATAYLYREYHVSASQIEVYSGFAHLAWAMKPLIGIASDLVPIFGYRKAPYAAAASIIGIVACLVIGLGTPSTLPIIGFVICTFFCQFNTVTCDLLAESKYAEKIQDHPEHGSSLNSFVWFGMKVAVLIAAITSGVAISQLGAHAVYQIAGVALLMIIFIPIVYGFWDERPQTVEQSKTSRETFAKNVETIFLCSVLLCGTMAMSYGALVVEDCQLNCIIGMIVFAVVLTSFSLTLSPVIARVNAFALCRTALNWKTGSAAFYFYTDSAEEYPQGPHFDPFFYNTVMGSSGALASVLGIAFYYRYMSTWRYRSIIMFTNVALLLLHLCDAVVFTRMNLKFGIPDEYFVFGTAALEHLVFWWMWMPCQLVIAYLCPKGQEATMYALLAGCANLGGSIASNNGALLLQYLSCNPTGQVGDATQLENYWKVSLFHTLAGFTTLACLVYIFPDVRQNEKLLEGEALQDPCHNSLWRRWQG
eukprot:TRINITY_DN16778_c0_g2_i1.p1 TRINITY_DN16778_c0_g2~~TRINITY_DN16778_c0_g2_i1.p1  ORF type:complete len:563 (-),score=65.68 TRINITY_DN16778_c0_g2_i1:273-1961(-)